MATGDVWEITPIWDNDDTGERLTSHLHITESPAGAPGINDIGDAVKDWWNTNVTGANAQKVRHEAAISLIQVDLRRINPLSALIQSYTTGLPIAGTGTGQNVSPNDAILVSVRTGLVGRRYRGRMYLPPYVDSTLSGPGTIDDASGDETRIAMEALKTALEAITNVDNVVVWSAVGGVATDVTSYRVDRRIRSQRRRAAEAPLYT